MSARAPASILMRLLAAGLVVAGIRLLLGKV